MKARRNLRETKKKNRGKKTNNKMADINPNISIITVNVKIQLYFIYEELIKYNNIDRLKVKGWKKRYRVGIKEKRSVYINISHARLEQMK